MSVQRGCERKHGVASKNGFLLFALLKTPQSIRGARIYSIFSLFKSSPQKITNEIIKRPAPNKTHCSNLHADCKITRLSYKPQCFTSASRQVKNCNFVKKFPETMTVIINTWLNNDGSEPGIGLWTPWKTNQCILQLEYNQ